MSEFCNQAIPLLMPVSVSEESKSNIEYHCKKTIHQWYLNICTFSGIKINRWGAGHDCGHGDVISRSGIA